MFHVQLYETCASAGQPAQNITTPVYPSSVTLSRRDEHNVWPPQWFKIYRFSVNRDYGERRDAPKTGAWKVLEWQSVRAHNVGLEGVLMGEC